jgi:hypothetical protein
MLVLLLETLNFWDVVFHGCTQNTQFDFAHVQLTAMFRGVMEFQLSQDTPRFLRRECFVQGGGFVGGQVVQHNADKNSF